MFKVNEIYETFQGEGVLLGVPVTVLRFAGCSLGCVFCDTRYAWDKNKGKEYSRKDLVKMFDRFEYQSGKKYVLVTGGEPLEQEGILDLLGDFTLKGIKYILETNGMIGEYFNPRILGGGFVVVSPKLKSALEDRYDRNMWIKALDLWEDMRRAYDLSLWYKFVIKEEDKEEVKKLIGHIDGRIVYISPVWDKVNKMKKIVKWANDEGFRITVQVHKFLGFK